ncbi:MAG TPA: hypothetical protein DIT64_05475 [Verrucomicrobiales bacterium]|nr:hypothetical protein [Verrucomicrobiales bacterium]
MSLIPASLTFANPLGLWALLGLPVVVAIHFLQRRQRRVTCTTLFLLEQMRRESRTGNRFEKLRVSIPFWLQLLMVLLLAWLLAQPRWLGRDAVQRVAVVLDASASMAAFRAPAERAVHEVLGQLRGPPAAVELTLLTTDATAPALYHGPEPVAMRRALAAWQPLLGAHDPAPALRVARGLAGAEGLVVLVTDHRLDETPAHGAQVLAVGEATDNVGWAGVRVEEKDGQWLWHALVKNHGRSPQQREWRALAAGVESSAKTLALAPGEMLSLSGPFPAEGDGRLLLRLSGDALPLDDELPLVRPAPKTLAVFAPAVGLPEAMRHLLESLPHTGRSASPVSADLEVAVWREATLLPEGRHALVILPPPARDAPFPKGGIVAEPHPLMEGLNWQGLLPREAPAPPRLTRDSVLLWQGERPLILLRQMPAGGRLLLCLFDPDSSGALRMPAFAVLAHRFLESLRAEKIAPESANYDTRQRLHLAHLGGPDAPPLVIETQGEAREVPPVQGGLLRAPARPGHFTVSQGGTVLLTAAAHFADTREADLSLAATWGDPAMIRADLTQTRRETSPHQPLWLLALLLLLMGSWWWSRERNILPLQSTEASTNAS